MAVKTCRQHRVCTHHAQAAFDLPLAKMSASHPRERTVTQAAQKSRWSYKSGSFVVGVSFAQETVPCSGEEGSGEENRTLGFWLCPWSAEWP